MIYLNHMIKQILYHFLKNIVYVFSFFHIRIYVMIIFALNFSIWLAAYFVNTNAVQNLIVLHYNVNFGVDLIGGAEKLFIIPVLGLVIIFINLFLVFVFSKDKNFKFIAHLLLASCVIVDLFLLIALLLVFLINFR